MSGALFIAGRSTQLLRVLSECVSLLSEFVSCSSLRLLNDPGQQHLSPGLITTHHTTCLGVAHVCHHTH